MYLSIKGNLFIFTNKVYILVFLLIFICIASCNRTSKRDRLVANDHYLLGVDYIQKGNQRAALRELMRSERLYPDSAELHNAMGLLYHTMGMYEEALVHYNKSIEIVEDYPEVLNNIGAVYIDLEQFEKAKPYFEKALNNVLYPTPEFAQANLGWVMYKLGEKEKGIVKIKKSIFLNPKFCRGYKLLGQIEKDRGNLKEAVNFFKNMKQFCPDLLESYYYLANAKSAKGDKEGAKSLYLECVKRWPNDSMGKQCKKELEYLD